jgi:hypothetical protein
MAELKERLERLADLGTPRGAEAVWRGAQHGFVGDPIPSPTRFDRRRRRSRLVAAGLVVALAAAGLAYVLTGRDQRTVVSVAPSRTTDSLVLIDNGAGPLTLVDVATGVSRFVTLPGKVGGDFTYDVIATGGYFVYQSARGVLAIPTSLNRVPHLVGRASAYLPSSRPGRVWLFTIPRGGVPTRGQEVSVDGRYRGPRYRLPFAGAATAAVNGGLIRGGTVWSTATNTTRAIPGSRSGTPNVFDAHGSLVAWGVSCQPVLPGCAALAVVNLADNTEHTYPAPAGTAGWVPTAGEGSHDAFAADGGHLALRVAITSTPLLSRVYVLSLATGTSTLLPNTQAGAYSPVAWSPDGRSVLYENTSHTLATYRLGDESLRTLSQHPCCGALITAPR